MQAAIASQSGGTVGQIYIPTPDAIPSSVNYGQLYRPVFSQPATYIRFSLTVEDTSGVAYCMTEEDDAALKKINQKQDAGTQCSEDQFEEVMNFFEEAAFEKQPYAFIENSPPMPFEDMHFDETVSPSALVFAKEIYEHWKSRRTASGSRRLQSNIKVRQSRSALTECVNADNHKLEKDQEADEGDPYVCFRRREIRQTRKTRARDTQSADKLRKLRRELEDARQIVALVKQRELTAREMLAMNRQVFEQRLAVKEAKRALGIKGDDEDLINQKVKEPANLDCQAIAANVSQPKKKTAPETPATLMQSQVSSTFRPSTNASDNLRLLEQDQAAQARAIAEDVNGKEAQHRRWNEGYVDITRAPLTPPPEDSMTTDFRKAVTEYLPTPPASLSSRDSADGNGGLESPVEENKDSVVVRYASPSWDGPSRGQTSFRRRYGRGGRMWIDRRGVKLQAQEAREEKTHDRFRFDQDDEEEEVRYEIDPHSILSIRYRASILGSNRDREAQMQAAQAQAARRLQNQQAITDSQSDPQRKDPQAGAAQSVSASS